MSLVFPKLTAESTVPYVLFSEIFLIVAAPAVLQEADVLWLVLYLDCGMIP